MLRIVASKVTWVGRARSAVVGLAAILTLLVGAGCGESSDQGQALEEQQQKNEELQKELDAQEEQQEEAARQEEAEEQAEKQEEMEQKIDELEEQVEENESEPQETNQPEPESDSSPEVVIESNDDWTAPPSQAPQGVVVVSPDYNVGAVTTEEAQVLDAAIAYYQAVEVGDYYATHSLLSVDDQSFFPVDAWVEANTVLDSAAGEFVVTDAYPEDIGNGSPTYAVTLVIYFPDGSSSSRTTYFTDEGNGYWAHWLTEEEMALFNGAL